jgi:hypothetical protein
LSERTFTITDVSGSIRRINVQCDRGGGRLEFEEQVEWSVPSGWNECTLTVAGKNATTFRLYQFRSFPALNLSVPTIGTAITR